MLRNNYILNTIYIYIYGNKPPLRNELGLVFRVFGFGGLR